MGGALNIFSYIWCVCVYVHMSACRWLMLLCVCLLSPSIMWFLGSNLGAQTWQQAPLSTESPWCDWYQTFKAIPPEFSMSEKSESKTYCYRRHLRSKLILLVQKVFGGMTLQCRWASKWTPSSCQYWITQIFMKLENSYGLLPTHT